MNGTRDLRLQVPLLPGQIMSCKHCTISARVESSWNEILHVNVLGTLIQSVRHQHALMKFRKITRRPAVVYLCTEKRVYGLRGFGGRSDGLE